MADDDKDKRTTVQRATTANKAARTDEPVSGDFPGEDQKVVGDDGVFKGETRYEGTVLVDRVVGDEVVQVMTDKPRPGDRVQAHTLNDETGELEQSKESTTKAGAARMPGKS
jgi:hypothetical protein